MQAVDREIKLLRRQIYGLVAAVVALGGALIVLTIAPNRVVRTRTLIIQGPNGRDRIVLGAPVPDPIEGKRLNPTVGLVINDANGHERFGLGLQDSGRMVMGLDAPPGAGDDRNRERITLVADEQGGATVRILDRHTRIAGRLVLDPEDRVWLEFLRVGQETITTRRIGLDGDRIDTEQR
jgi:hypothetical protein